MAAQQRTVSSGQIIITPISISEQCSVPRRIFPKVPKDFPRDGVGASPSAVQLPGYIISYRDTTATQCQSFHDQTAQRKSFETSIASNEQSISMVFITIICFLCLAIIMAFYKVIR